MALYKCVYYYYYYSPCAPRCSNLHDPEVATCADCRTTLLGSSSRRQNDPTPLLNTLHWLPVQQRIDYSVALLTFKVRSTSTPSYLHRLLQDREDVHNLRRRSDTPALCSLLTVHQDNNRKARFPLHSTSHLELAPKTVLDSETVTSFKSRLKTHLFSQALSHTPTDH